MSSVIRAARTLVSNGVVTLITVEMDAPGSSCLQDLADNPAIRSLLRQPALFSLQSNSWMPFHEDSQLRQGLNDRNTLRSGCQQLFRNLTLTPEGELAACCGLTMEHIPEMKLRSLPSSAPIAARYCTQFEDFLKIWINVDGPYTIILRLLGPDAEEELQDIVHLCQACAILHQHPEIRAQLQQRYKEFVPEVMSRFYLQRSIDAQSAHGMHIPFPQPSEKEKSL